MKLFGTKDMIANQNLLEASQGGSGGGIKIFELPDGLVLELVQECNESGRNARRPLDMNLTQKIISSVKDGVLCAIVNDSVQSMGDTRVLARAIAISNSYTNINNDSEVIVGFDMSIEGMTFLCAIGYHRESNEATITVSKGGL